MKKQQNFISFMEQFSTEEKCFKYLTDVKWAHGFECKKCGCTESIKGRTWHHKRCKSCKYDESCTANTFFHKIKIPLPVAFAIVYQLCTMKKGMSSCEIARQYGIHQESAWFFKRKVQRAMQESDQGLLSGVVEVDETIIGGYEPGAKGRSHGRKKSVMLAVEIGHYDKKKGRSIMLRAKAVEIEDYSGDSLKSAIGQSIKEKSVLITDRWRGYLKAVKDRFHLPVLSEQGTSMPEIHQLIFNLKNWIRGTHHHISRAHIQSYLDEFFFRFNFRNRLHTLPKLILGKMVELNKTTYNCLVAG